MEFMVQLLFFRAVLAKILLRRPLTIRLYANLHLKFVLERASNIMILTIQLCLWSSLQHDLEIVRLILLLWYCVNQHPCNLGHREGLGPTIRMLFIGVKVFLICYPFQLFFSHFLLFRSWGQSCYLGKVLWRLLQTCCSPSISYFQTGRGDGEEENWTECLKWTYNYSSFKGFRY